MNSERLDARGCLGFVLALSGIRALAQAMGMFAQYAWLDGLSRGALLAGLPLLVALLQLTAGTLFAFGKPGAGWIALIAYAGAAIGLAIFGVVELADASVASTVATVLETAGVPLIAVVAVVLNRPNGSTARQEVGVVLLVFGVAAVLGLVLHVIETVRLMVMLGGSDVLGLGSTLLWLAISLTVAVFEVRAGLLLHRGDARAQRALGAFVVASLVEVVVSFVLMLGMKFIEGTDSFGMLLALRSGRLMMGVAFPLVIWAFVRSRPSSVSTAASTSPAWIALFIVPFLIARPLIFSETLEAMVGDTATVGLTVGFAVLAVATAVACGAALRERASAAAIAVVATMVAVVMLCAFQVVVRFDESARHVQPGPLLPLVVSLAVLAWLHRTATPAVPRAIVRR